MLKAKQRIERLEKQTGMKEKGPIELEFVYGGGPHEEGIKHCVFDFSDDGPQGKHLRGQAGPEEERPFAEWSNEELDAKLIRELEELSEEELDKRLRGLNEETLEGIYERLERG